MICHRYVIAIVLMVCGCASAGATDTPRQSRNTDVLTAAELQNRQGLTLYQLIERERPNWLRIRGRTSVNPGEDAITVYLDEVRQGGLGVLRDINPDVVASVRFISGPEAEGRFGPGHQSGAILVSLKRRS